MSVTRSNGIRQGRSRYEEEEGEGHQHDQFIFKKERSWKRIDAEAGQVRVVPVFRESTSRTASLLHNYELNCIEMDPNSLLVPQYITVNLYIYAYKGKGRISWVHNRKLVEQDLEAGQIYYVPKGSLFYVINNEKNQRLHIINFLHNENRVRSQRHHELFYVAGGQNSPTVFSGFRRETLTAAFGIDSREVEKVLSRQERGAIVSMGQEHGKEQRTDELLSWPWSSSKKHESSEEEKPFDIQKKKPDFTNDNGQYIKADRKSFSPFKRSGVAIALTKIQKGRMTAPRWNNSAFEVSVVLSGGGRVEIVRPDSAEERSREERGSERERGSE